MSQVIESISLAFPEVEPAVPTSSPEEPQKSSLAAVYWGIYLPDGKGKPPLSPGNPLASWGSPVLCSAGYSAAICLCAN